MRDKELQKSVWNLIVGGFKGRGVDEVLKERLKAGLGGVILFDRNVGEPEEVRELTDEIAGTVKQSPLICVDQEGGRVQRLKKGYSKFPTARTVGKYFENGGDVKKIYELASYMAMELRESGINVNFAPVLDIIEEGQGGPIGDRSFSGSALTVSEVGLIYSAAFQDQGIISVVKHFPGHGITEEDSHETLPVVDISPQELQSFHMRPFIHAVKNSVFGVMTAHITYRRVDAENPASCSSKFIMDVLRRDLNFDGLIISDDLCMGAVKEWGDVGEFAVRSLLAGCDMFIVSDPEGTAEQVVSSIYDAVKKGRVPEKRLRLSSDWIDEIRGEMTEVRKELPPLNLQIFNSEKTKSLIKEIQAVAGCL